MTKSVNRLSITWILLSGITILSWRLAARNVGQSIHLDAAITTAVIAFALVKTRFIMREFMDVRRAPFAIKLLSDGWLVAVFAILITVYHQA